MLIKSMSSRFFNSKNSFDIFGDFRSLEVLAADYKLLMDSKLDSRDNVTNENKSRYIIEVTKENIDYCKVIMKAFDLRHLNNLKGNFILHENNYSFISTNPKYNIDGNKKEEFDKNVALSIVTCSSREIIVQQQELFDTLWYNSQPANEIIRELEKEEEKILNASCYDYSDGSLTAVERFYKDDNKNVVQITKDPLCIKSLILSGVYNAKAEILLSVSSIDQFKYFSKIDLKEVLNHALAKGVRIIILYPEDKNPEIINKYITNLVSTTEENVHLSGVSGPIGTVMIVDNAKIILIDNDKGNKPTNNDILGVYSNNKSIVSNFGSLFDILLIEKEVLDYAVQTKIQLENSNRHLEEYNQRIKIASEVQKEFINMAAHELRTPIQAILGNIELLDISAVCDISNQDYLNSIVRNSNRLARLVEDLLNVARIESNNVVLHKEKTNLVELIDLVIKDFKTDLQTRSEESNRRNNNNYKKNIEIFSSWDVDEKENLSYAFDVMIDRNKIIQVLTNLIDNSLNSIYNDKDNSNIDGNSVRIMITEITNREVEEIDSINNCPNFRKHDLLITVKDTGKGINFELFPRLFEKFATNSPSGTGLGLYIAKAIIEAHGGRIWAENNKNENGAIFSFTLPTL